MAVWVYYGVIVGVFVTVAYIILNIFTYKLVVVVKERIGKDFDFANATTLKLEEDKKQEKKSNRFDTLIEQFKPKKGEEPKKSYKAIATVTKTYRGKIVKKRGKYTLLLYRFLRKPLRLKVQGAQYWNFSGGSKRRIELIKLSSHIYTPLMTVMDNETYKQAVINEDYFDWIVNDIEEDNKKFQLPSFWDRYGSFIITGVTFMMCIIFVVVVFKNLQAFADAGKEGAEAMAAAFERGCVQTVE